MNCPDALSLMAFMDGELSPEERAEIAGHVSGCDRCTSFLKTQAALEKSWRDSWQDPPDFRFAAMRKNIPLGKPAGRTVPGWLIGIAAGVAAVFLGMRVFPGQGQPGLEQVIQNESAIPDAARSDLSVADSVSVPVGEADTDQGEESSEAMPLAETETTGMDVCLSLSSTSSEDAPSGFSGEGRAGLFESGEEEEQQEMMMQSEASSQTMPAQASQDSDMLEQACGEIGDDATEQSPSPAESTVAVGGSVAPLDAQSTGSGAGAGGGGYTACYAAEYAAEGTRDRAESKAFSLVCERPDGALVTPWDELSAFVDSLFCEHGLLPGVFFIDPAGYTIMQEGIPRAFLGVTDPARVPLTVRVIPR